MKRIVLLAAVFILACTADYSFAAESGEKGASTQAYEHASDRSVFNRFGDWFATVGRPEEQKTIIMEERKTKRAKNRTEKEAHRAEKAGKHSGKDAEKTLKKSNKATEKGLKGVEKSHRKMDKKNYKEHRSDDDEGYGKGHKKNFSGQKKNNGKGRGRK